MSPTGPEGNAEVNIRQGIDGIFVFCCYITNHHKLSGLKQHRFIILKFPWVRDLAHLSRFSAQDSIRPESKCQLAVFSSRGSTRGKKKSAFKICD